MGTDPNGTLVGWLIGLIIGAIIGAVIGATVAGVVAAENGVTGWALFGWIMLGMVGGAVLGGAIGAGIAYIAPSIGTFLSSSFTFGAGIAMAGSGAAVATVTVTGAQIAAGVAAAGALAGMVLFAKGSGPRMGHNQHENKQFRDAMKELKIQDKDTQRWIHDSLQGENLDTYKKLIEFIKRLLGM